MGRVLSFVLFSPLLFLIFCASSDVLQLPVTCASPIIRHSHQQRNEHLTSAETKGIRKNRRQGQDGETNVATIKLMKEILDKVISSDSEKSYVVYDEEEFVQIIIGKHGARFSDHGRFKRETSGETGNNSSTNDDTSCAAIAAAKVWSSSLRRSGTGPPSTVAFLFPYFACVSFLSITSHSKETAVSGDRLGHLTARWATIIGGILIVICSILIVVYYCKCKARCVRGLRGASFEDNPRATVSVVPSRGFQRPPVLNNQAPLNNSSFGHFHGNFDHHRAPPGYTYMKSLEKDPERRASELMYDL